MKYLDDILIVIGEALIIIGTYLISPIATLFVAGIILILDGLAVAWSNNK